MLGVGSVVLWFPLLREVIRNAVASCEACQQTWPNPPRVAEASWPPAELWERLLVDFGMLDGRDLVIFDAGTSWVEGDWVKGPSARSDLGFEERVPYVQPSRNHRVG